MSNLRTELPFSIELRVDLSKLANQASLLPSHAMALDVPVPDLEPSTSYQSNRLRIRHNWQLEQVPFAPIGRTAHDPRTAAIEMLAAADLLNKLGLLFDTIVYATTADIVPTGIIFDSEKHMYTATPPYRRQSLQLGSPVTTPTQFFVFEVTKIDFESPINLRAKVFGIGSLVLVSFGTLVEEADKLNGAFNLFNDGYEYVVHPHKEARSAIANAYLSQMKKERSSHNVRTVQSCLKLLGYDPGQIDGKAGHSTKAAISEFAKNHNLSPELDSDSDVLLEALSRESAAVSKISS